MKIQHLDTAIQEAERFLERARVAKKAHAEMLKQAPESCATWLKEKAAADLHYSNPRENGALRRSSMDLTRALAELRGRAK